MQSVETKRDFSISELSEAASVTTRTIRYYVAEGLLASPEKGGRGATYNGEHLARLQLIRRLKEEYLPLQEIATLMRGLDRKAVMDLLEQKQRTSVAPRSSAKAYLKDLLEASGASDSGRLSARKSGGAHEAGAGDPARRRVEKARRRRWGGAARSRGSPRGKREREGDAASPVCQRALSDAIGARLGERAGVI